MHKSTRNKLFDLERQRAFNRKEILKVLDAKICNYITKTYEMLKSVESSIS